MFFVSPAGAVQQQKQLQPGVNYIRITSQVITKDKKGTIKYAAYALYNKPTYIHSIGNGVSRCNNIGNRRTLPRGTQVCNYIFRFPLGQIVTAGVVTSPVYFKLAVTGGTGLYANIGGQVQVITTKLKPLKQNLSFTIFAYGR